MHRRSRREEARAAGYHEGAFRDSLDDRNTFALVHELDVMRLRVPIEGERYPRASKNLEHGLTRNPYCLDSSESDARSDVHAGPQGGALRPRNFDQGTKGASRGIDDRRHARDARRDLSASASVDRDRSALMDERCEPLGHIDREPERGGGDEQEERRPNADEGADGYEPLRDGAVERRGHPRIAQLTRREHPLRLGDTNVRARSLERFGGRELVSHKLLGPRELGMRLRELRLGLGEPRREILRRDAREDLAALDPIAEIGCERENGAFDPRRHFDSLGRLECAAKLERAIMFGALGACDDDGSGRCTPRHTALALAIAARTARDESHEQSRDVCEPTARRRAKGEVHQGVTLRYFGPMSIHLLGCARPGLARPAHHLTALCFIQLWICMSVGAALAQAEPVVDDRDLFRAVPLPTAADAVTLREAFEIADRDAIDIELARLDVERGEAAERIAWAGLLPVVMGGLTYQRFDQPIVRSTTITDPDGMTRTDQLIVRDENALSGSITVSETLSLRSIAAVHAAEDSSELARTVLDDLRRRLRASIARTFFTVLSARRVAELARSQIEDALRQLRAAQTRAELGSATSLDVARAEVAALEAARRRADADQALVRAWDQLGDALGRTEPIDAVASRLESVPIDESQAIERAIGMRSDVQSAEMSRRRASRAVDDAWFRFAPSLTISWTGSFTEPRTAFNPNTQWIALVSLSVPFYDGGARYGALRDAQLAVEQADERVELVRRAVRLEIRDAYRRLATAERGVAIAARQVAVARQAAVATEAGFASGGLTGLELDSARRSLEQAELQQILAELEQENARVDLLAAVGEL